VVAVKLSKEQAQKRLVSLKKNAEVVAIRHGLGAQKAYVVLVLDISVSMSSLYRQHVVQDVCTRALGLAMNFDDNGAADVFLFGRNDHEVGEISQENFYNFVEGEILSRYPLEPSTHYAGVMKRILNRFAPKRSALAAVGAAASTVKRGLLSRLFGGGESSQVAPASGERSEPLDYPVYVMFVTDGDNHDPEEAERVIREASNHGIFWQFIGVGNSSFSFLDELDNLKGRRLDNANFFHVNDLERITDDELYDRMLGEFPSWIPQAKAQGMIK
jgi:hypothetical protein